MTEEKHQLWIGDFSSVETPQRCRTAETDKRYQLYDTGDREAGDDHDLINPHPDPLPNGEGDKLAISDDEDVVAVLEPHDSRSIGADQHEDAERLAIFHREATCGRGPRTTLHL